MIHKLLTATLALLFVPLAAAQTTRPAEVRGTWLTTTANDAISTPQKTAESMKTLADMGFNTAYVECWKNGYTEFPSDTMRDLVGVEMKINDAPPELQRDLLQETTIEAHRNGLLMIGWFEYGFMAAHKDTHNELRQLARDKGWLTLTQDGKEVGEQNPFVWLNPLHPETQQLVLDIVLEAVDQYDLDGVQLDDRIAMPVEMGYDDYTKQLYAKEHGGQMPPADPREPHWVQWRADKISAYAKEFAAQVRQKRPGLIVSVSPAPYPWSLDNYCCDWPTDAWQGWDEFVPQCYRTSFPAFEANWREQVDVSERDDDLVAGIRVVGEGADTPWPDVVQKMDLAGELGGGWCIWFSRAVLSVYPDEFRQYLAEKGPASNPHKPADWRPSPIRLNATRSLPPQFFGNAPADAYRVIGKIDGRWRVLDTITHPGGPLKLDPATTADATAVELLVDRRE